jgi:hypothetical protein
MECSTRLTGTRKLVGCWLFLSGNGTHGTPHLANRGHQEAILDQGERMGTATRQRPRTAKRSGKRNASNSRAAVDFPPGSLEADLLAIGKSVPAQEWAKFPEVYFANLDHYLYGAPKKK